MNKPISEQSLTPCQEGTRNIVIGQKVTSAKVQRAKELRRDMTPEERILWQHLRANRLHGFHFRRQQIIKGFITDFYCHGAKLVIEVDGGIHQRQVEYDTNRDEVSIGRGLRILRISNEEIRQNIDDVLTRILKSCTGIS